MAVKNLLAMVTAWGFLGLIYMMTIVAATGSGQKVMPVALMIFFVFSLLFTLLMTFQTVRVHILDSSFWSMVTLLVGSMGVAVHIYFLLAHFNIGTRPINSSALLILLLIFLLLYRR